MFIQPDDGHPSVSCLPSHLISSLLSLTRPQSQNTISVLFVCLFAMSTNAFVGIAVPCLTLCAGAGLYWTTGCCGYCNVPNGPRATRSCPSTTNICSSCGRCAAHHRRSSGQAGNQPSNGNQQYSNAHEPTTMNTTFTPANLRSRGSQDSLNTQASTAPLIRRSGSRGNLNQQDSNGSQVRRPSQTHAATGRK